MTKAPWYSTNACSEFAPRNRLVCLPPRGEGLEVDGELAVIVAVCPRADLALDLLHGYRNRQRLDDQLQFVRRRYYDCARGVRVFATTCIQPLVCDDDGVCLARILGHGTVPK